MQGMRRKSIRAPRNLCGAVSVLLGIYVIISIILLIEARGIVAMAVSDADSMRPSSSHLGSRMDGILSLLKSRPNLSTEMIIRVVVATVVMVNLDAFLKFVVTPALAATIIGAVATPLTFFIGQTLQPIIYSICFFHFDDKFILASLESTGIKQRLASKYVAGKWTKVKFFEKYSTRFIIKAIAGWFVGVAGVATIIPLAGPVIAASLSGWVVAWDFVYVPLLCIGHKGVIQQAKVVYANLRQYHWFGFWAILAEEIPLVGAVCHVYNIYCSAFFLEKLYLKDQCTNERQRKLA